MFYKYFLWTMICPFCMKHFHLKCSKHFTSQLGYTAILLGKFAQRHIGTPKLKPGYEREPLM